MVVPAAPVNPDLCSLDVASPFYSSDTVELFSVKDAQGKDTGLLFKTIPATMNADDKAVQKAWAEKDIANETYIFERFPSDPRLVQFYGEHTIDGRKGILLEKIQDVSLEEKFRKLNSMEENQAKEILANSTELYQTIKAARQKLRSGNNSVNYQQTLTAKLGQTATSLVSRQAGMSSHQQYQNKVRGSSSRAASCSRSSRIWSAQ